ncbi:uncharacterized protein NECHADRAFT_47770 [Fusarium vanettenii 77-13-4]|uniref:C2H2-type domain-containing protein n=1 Tax=Fusarium vanettenii (strain ATCC MYA-4622 / CBS 123669 / FGSC 9596 / NRRL 45880 / 77-13-4) TaxID=660122 RepID=C7YZZ3_FUSV7|nr:uncharacterized protein NECHADRAFT_47770 [Fusarium vanettenii 77-13-4]EEU42697.1 hypothetical protein NECHADRAFT_47770 [Fusarium vanettenii 77-13-4]
MVETQIKCDICNCTFARQEHLTRHSRSHTREKPYQCLQCSKSFSRLDVLQRHISSHEQSASDLAGVSTRACRDNEQDAENSTMDLSVPSTSDQAIWAPTINLASNTGFPLGPTGAAFRSVDSNNVALGSGFHEPVLSMSALNWLSPQYQEVPEWDSQLIATSGNGMALGNFEFALGFSQTALSPDTPPQDYSSQIQRPLVEHGSWILPEQQDGEPVDMEQSRSVSTKSSTSSRASRVTEGRLYVDGAAARAPFSGCLTETQSAAGVSPSDRSTGAPNHPASPLSTGFTTGTMLSAGEDFIIESVYDDLILQVQSIPHIKALGLALSTMPPLPHIQRFVKLYFEKFHPSYPFVQKSRFSTSTRRPILQSDDWVLLLAVSAVGAWYCPEAQSLGWRDVMFEMVNAHMVFCISSPPQDDHELFWRPSGQTFTCVRFGLPTLQASILNLIWMVQSGRENLVHRAMADRHHIVEQCKALNLLSMRESGFKDTSPPELQAERWSDFQAKIRTGMMTWLLDCIFVFEFNCQPLIHLADVSSPLPCTEQLWEPPTLEEINSKNKPGPMPEAIEILYMEKRLPPHLGEFGYLLLIYAILARTREAMTQYQTRLSNWVPNARIESRSTLQSVAETWPPALPIMSKWRNSACDCLDILHWYANGTVARAGGLEHPTILHLHLSRLLLLTPIKHMQYVAALSDVRSSGGSFDKIKYKEACGHLRKWAVADQFKARLSLVHAGAVLWYVRRYSVNDILEPFAVYVATLCLWVYSVSTVSAVHQQDQQEPRARSSSGVPDSGEREDSMSTAGVESDEEPELYFIYLDRPCDDEMVQTYVRLGHKMSANLLRVGNICNIGAPRKILQEGSRLLSGKGRRMSRLAQSPANRWGISNSFGAILESLIQATPVECASSGERRRDVGHDLDESIYG